MNTALVTAIGSFSSDCVIHTLKSYGWRVIGCDIYPQEWHPVSRDCDKVYRAPYATNEDEYVKFLIDTCTNEDVKCIIPLTDLEIDIINTFRKVFINCGIVVCMPSPSTLATARDKYKIYQTFKDCTKFRCVPTYKIGINIVPADILPCIAKPFNGRSSEGLKRIATFEELQPILTNSNYIVQPLVDGPIITVDYVRSAQTEHDFAIPRKELLRTKNGAGTTVEVYSDNGLFEIVSEIGRTIDVNGCVNMEFILNNGNYYLIDINPRFSAGVAFSKMAGYDMVTSHVNCHLGHDILPPVKYKPQIIAKRYVEEVLRLL